METEKNKLNNSSVPEDRKATTDASSSLSLESAYGSVRPSAKPEDWDEVTRKAKDSKAEETVHELREQLGS